MRRGAVVVLGVIGEQALEHGGDVAGGDGGAGHRVHVHPLDLGAVAAPGVEVGLLRPDQGLDEVLVHVLLGVLGAVVVGVAVPPQAPVLPEGDGPHGGLFRVVLVVEQLHVGHRVVVHDGVPAGAGGEGHLIAGEGGVALLEQDDRLVGLLGAAGGVVGVGEGGVLLRLLRPGGAAGQPGGQRGRQQQGGDASSHGVTPRGGGGRSRCRRSPPARWHRCSPPPRPRGRR